MLARIQLKRRRRRKIRKGTGWRIRRRTANPRLTGAVRPPLGTGDCTYSGIHHPTDGIPYFFVVHGMVSVHTAAAWLVVAPSSRPGPGSIYCHRPNRIKPNVIFPFFGRSRGHPRRPQRRRLDPTPSSAPSSVAPPTSAPDRPRCPLPLPLSYKDPSQNFSEPHSTPPRGRGEDSGFSQAARSHVSSQSLLKDLEPN